MILVRYNENIINKILETNITYFMKLIRWCLMRTLTINCWLGSLMHHKFHGTLFIFSKCFPAQEISIYLIFYLYTRLSFINPFVTRAFFIHFLNSDHNLQAYNLCQNNFSKFCPFCAENQRDFDIKITATSISTCYLNKLSN